MKEKFEMGNQGVSRKTELDVAKGMALFLVVFGHVYLKRTGLSNWIFMFHMPAFFFFSGMTFKPEKYLDRQHGFWQFFKDKWKSRIVPYFAITAIGFVICMIRPFYRQPILEKGWWHMTKWIFYYAQPKELYIGQVWFLVGLFSAEVITYLWFMAFRKCSSGVKALGVLALAWFAMVVPQINTMLPIGHRLPWKLDTGLCAAVFVIAGYYSVKWKIWERCRGAEWFLCPFCLWLSYYYGPKWYGYTNICDCLYSPGPYYYLVAILGTASVIFFATLCKKCPFWQYCGRYSLPLFALQTFVIWIIAEIITKTTGMELEPMKIPGKGLSLAITIASFIIMALMVYPWHCYKKKRAGR